MLCCPDLCGDLCSEKLKLALWTASAALVFPFLVWGGYALLPFDSPLMGSAPHRVVYTLRCAVFASVPVLLGNFNPYSELYLGVNQKPFKL